MGGDFNAILNENEKEGESDKAEADMRNFQEALNKCSLSNLGWSGDRFTWSNLRFSKRLIKEHLNRFVSSYDWWSRFSGAKVTNVNSIGSDHCPIRVEVLGPENLFGKRRKKWASSFHFEDFWMQYEECKEIISSSWNSRGDLMLESKKCKQKLKQCSKRKFKSRFNILKNLKAEIANLKKLPPSESVAMQIWKAEKEVKLFLTEEESFGHRKRKRNG